tara:strand:- start:302 stop:793 length:492 start_codon:yes stop_codon:yes gene_type:complete
MADNKTPKEFAQQRVNDIMFPKKLQEAVKIADERNKSFGYKVRKKLGAGEIEFFKKNPNTAGYASFETDSIVLNPFTTLDAEQLSFLVDNEAIRLKMNKDKFVPSEFSFTPEQKQFFSKTVYNDNPVAMRQTILARLYANDTSSGEFTSEQRKELKKYLSNNK